MACDDRPDRGFPRKRGAACALGIARDCPIILGQTKQEWATRIAVLGLIGSLCLGSAALAADAPVQVMIVGDFHMSNPGRDIHNLKVDDVLAPGRQAEIAAVTDALSRFHPTMVDAEWDADTVAQRYDAYLKGTLAPSRNEVVQLGFRLAKANGAAMHGIDVDGEFPFEAVQAYAAAHGQGALIDAQNKQAQDFVDRMAQILDKDSVAATLRFLNDPEEVARGQDFYRTMLKIGDGDDQPGAELMTAWYRRNFHICANLVQLARPGDRIVVFYGSGHGLLLRQCVSEMPGFVLVEPNGYLPR
jgi:hypothetical protein